jgi:hypothetical protein
VDEPRDAWRPLFFSRFLPLIKYATTLSKAALILNKEIWSIWNVTFKANQTPDIMSPFQVRFCFVIFFPALVKGNIFNMFPCAFLFVDDKLCCSRSEIVPMYSPLL